MVFPEIGSLQKRSGKAPSRRGQGSRRKEEAMLEVRGQVNWLCVCSFNLKTGQIAFFPFAVLEVENEVSCMLGKLSNKDLYLKLRPAPF